MKSLYLSLGSALLIATTGHAKTASAPQEETASPGNHAAFVDALTGGKVDISLRYRLAFIDQDSFGKDAVASTLQTLLGYRTGAFHGVSAYVQGRNVSVIGNTLYNDTLNGMTTRPTEADPEATEIDQAYLQYNGVPNTVIRAGRQKIKLGNKRFISALVWRQNHVSFDGASIRNTSLPDTTLFYSYAYNVNRAFTDDSPAGNFDDGTNVHLINASYSGLPIGTVTAYGYLLDLQGFAAAAGLASQTYGINLTGKQPLGDQGVSILYTAEYARQSDYAENTTSYDADYYHGQIGATWDGLTIKGGYEVLGSDDSVTAFKTPLALLHAYNGWADKFLATPAAGLEDIYGSIIYKISGTGSILDGTKLVVAYHDFSADDGGADYGTEWNALIARKFGKHYTASIKYANYQEDGFSDDTEKLWFTVMAKY